MPLFYSFSFSKTPVSMISGFVLLEEGLPLKFSNNLKKICVFYSPISPSKKSIIIKSNNTLKDPNRGSVRIMKGERR